MLLRPLKLVLILTLRFTFYYLSYIAPMSIADVNKTILYVIHLREISDDHPRRFGWVVISESLF